MQCDSDDWESISGPQGGPGRPLVALWCSGEGVVNVPEFLKFMKFLKVILYNGYNNRVISLGVFCFCFFFVFGAKSRRLIMKLWGGGSNPRGRRGPVSSSCVVTVEQARLAESGSCTCASNRSQTDYSFPRKVWVPNFYPILQVRRKCDKEGTRKKRWALSVIFVL